MISATQLLVIMPNAGSRVTAFVQTLNDAMYEYSIATTARQAAFIAQVAHESGELRYTRELADGTAYELRKDLGNTEAGDGPRFRGRGLLQITGRANYIRCGTSLGLDLINQPELLEAPVGACRSAGWFWSTRGLNDLADADKFGAITRSINGGFNHLDERISYWLKARKACGL